MRLCWICNKNEANTGEHIFKNKFLRETYGTGKLDRGNRVIIRKEENYNGVVVNSRKNIDSTNSDSFKFIDSLCKKCNGATSQDWDEQFDLFIENLLKNHVAYLSDRCVNLNFLKGGGTSKEIRGLYNYFCKLFGCRVFTCDKPVPMDVVSAVRGENYRNSLGVSIIYNSHLNMIESPGDFLHCGDLEGDPSDVLNYRWTLGFGAVVICFWFNTPKNNLLGSRRWFGRNKLIPVIEYV